MKKSKLTGNDIKKFRKKYKLSQADLGRLLGKTRFTISRWELGEVPKNTKYLPDQEMLRLSLEKIIINIRIAARRKTDAKSKSL